MFSLFQDNLYYFQRSGSRMPPHRGIDIMDPLSKIVEKTFSQKVKPAQAVECVIEN
jgi:hypothetical protein